MHTGKQAKVVSTSPLNYFGGGGGGVEMLPLVSQW